MGDRLRLKRRVEGEGEPSSSHRVEALQQAMAIDVAAVLNHRREGREGECKEAELDVAQPECGVGGAVGGKGGVGGGREILFEHHLEVDRRRRREPAIGWGGWECGRGSGRGSLGSQLGAWMGVRAEEDESQLGEASAPDCGRRLGAASAIHTARGGVGARLRPGGKVGLEGGVGVNAHAQSMCM